MSIDWEDFLLASAWRGEGTAGPPHQPCRDYFICPDRNVHGLIQAFLFYSVHPRGPSSVCVHFSCDNRNLLPLDGWWTRRLVSSKQPFGFCCVCVKAACVMFEALTTTFGRLSLKI